MKISGTMTFSKSPRKPWVKPAVLLLRISRDTFSGSVTGVEAAGKAGLPAKT